MDKSNVNEKKAKLTLQEKLAKRKYDIPKPLYYKTYRLLMSKMIAPKYKPHYTIKDDINECKGPCFLIWNHLSRLDHAFLMEASYPKKLSILAGYNEFFRSHLHTVFKLIDIIPKKNYTNDIPSVRAINSIIKKGGCVCFSPEGMSSIYGQNQPIVAGTGRFIKFYKIPVYFLKLSGSYLTSTKVCTDERCGRVECELSLLFTPEDLERMTPDEIEDKINEVFRHDDYEWNKEKKIKYKSKGNICKNLADICYKCPKCHKELSMVSEKNKIYCKECNNGAYMNDYYEFEPFDDSSVIPEFPTKWVENERMDIIKEIRENENYSFSEKVKVGYLPPYHFVKNKKTSELCGEGIMTIDHKGIHFKGTKLGKEWNFDLSYQAVFSLPIVTDTSFFSLYVNEEYHDFFPERRTVGKMLLLTEEMHRLHVNTWKNFKWYDYMYEPYVKDTNKGNYYV